LLPIIFVYIDEFFFVKVLSFIIFFQLWFATALVVLP